MDAAQTIQELLNPQAGLRCLPAFWKAVCRDEALARTPADQIRYIDENLMVLVRHVEPLANEGVHMGEPLSFAQLCNSLASSRSFEDIIAILPSRTKVRTGPPWLLIASEYHVKNKPNGTLYTASAELARAVLDSEYPEAMRGHTIFMMAEALNALGKHCQAVEILESFLGLCPSDYQDEPTMLSALDRSTKLAELTPDSRALSMELLARVISGLNERGNVQAALLLQSYLGLDNKDFHDVDTIQSALIRLKKQDKYEWNANLGKVVGRLGILLQLAENHQSREKAQLLQQALNMERVTRADDVIRELLDPKAGLRCLPAFWKIFCRDEALARNPTDRIRYVDEKLITLNRFVEPLATECSSNGEPTPFAELCKSLGAASSAADISNSYLQRNNEVPLWLLIATECHQIHRPLESLYAASANLARPQFDSEGSKATRGFSIFYMALSLCRLGKDRKAAEVMEWYLQLREGDYANKELMRSAIDRSTNLAELDANNRADFVELLAQTLLFISGRGPTQALLLLESYLQLTEKDYRDNVAMQAALARSTTLRDKTLTANRCADLLFRLTGILTKISNRGHVQVVQLLESCLHIDKEDYKNTATMRAALARSAKLIGWEEDENSLFSTQHEERSVKLFFADDTRVRLVTVLADALSHVNERGKIQAATLLESYLAKPIHEFATAAELDSVSPFNRVSYVDAWLRAVDVSHEYTLTTCRALVAFILEVREDVYVRHQQRVEFLRLIRGVWDTLQRVALERIDREKKLGPDGIQKSKSILRDLHKWAEQLQNRLLVERLFVKPLTVQDKGGNALENWEPWQSALFRTEDGFVERGILPEERENLTNTSSALACCLSDSENTRITSSSREVHELLEASNELRQQLFTPEGVHPELHDLLPLGAVWIRVMLDDEDGLHWWAWKRDSVIDKHFHRGNKRQRLSNSAKQKRVDSLNLLDEGSSQPGAYHDLAVANLRFDLKVERIWRMYDCRTFDDLQDEDCLRKLLHLGTEKNYRQKILSNTEEMLFARKSVDKALTSIARTAPLLARQGGHIAHAIFQKESIEDLETWMFEDLEAGLDALANPWKENTVEREAKRKDALNEVSQRHLAMVQQHFDIRSLWSKLPSGRWPDIDIIFQVPGPLLTAPLAWLPFGPDGTEPLLKEVASTSSVISLTLRQQAAKEAQKQKPLRRILSAHWEEPQRRNQGARGLYNLEKSILEAGQKHGWEVWCLGDRPEATVSNLQSAANGSHRRFGVLVVNGHGISETYGVKLAQDTQWQGSGIDLRDTDLIFLAACSVGRLRDDGIRDVEGLCAELAAHHGRSIIAARWPIADTETAVFASEIVQEYLEVANAAVSAGQALPAFSRARALNRVRCRQLANGDITFHLAAAFEIYGLG